MRKSKGRSMRFCLDAIKMMIRVTGIRAVILAVVRSANIKLIFSTILP